ncbi:MAG TPA: UDP-N-acetylmuramoyl-L-alanyl-D-glutamate--2,6-diaminopimelate ligase, partial [Trueperaceae bacterium]
AALHHHPSRALVTLGVTGTDGKTTTATLLHHLLSAAFRTGLLSTAGIRIGKESRELVGHFTTPEAPEVQAFLAEFRDAGCTHAVVESSSHAFAQHRLDEVAYDLGVWTNLTPEHLDYHGSFEAYRDAKLSLARRAHVSVLNADDPSFEHFAAAAAEFVSYGIETPHADWRAMDIDEQPGRLRWRLLATIDGESVEAQAELPMVGAYNVANALAALAAASRVGIGLPLLLERMAGFPGVPGRMQVIQAQPFAVVVDFAHTAPALAKALAAVRPQTRGRVIVVVGAAGERDPGKRAPLGEAAVRHADLAVFTEEDHRSEDVGAILAAMTEGARAAGGMEGRDFLRVPDRREAIRRAVALAAPGDLVLLAGKGHEATLERDRESLAWNEAAEAEQALAERYRA